MDKTGFFEETPGNFSIMRLLAFMCVSAGILIGLVQAGMDVDINSVVVLGLVSAGLGAKYAQKGKELLNKMK